MRTTRSKHGYPQILPIVGALTLLTTTTGCWPGRRLADREFKYKHPAVRWVYRTGGQVAVTPRPVGAVCLGIPHIIQNRVSKLRTNDTHIYVTEGGPGCITWSVCRPVYELDLATGWPLLAWRPTRDKQNFVLSEWDDTTQEWSVRLNPHLAVVRPAASKTLVLRSDGNGLSDSLLLEFPPQQGCGIPSYIVEISDNVLVVTLRYIICLDLKQMPGYPFDEQNTARGSRRDTEANK